MVSIIIPVFNNERTIRTMLESVQKQTYGDFEAIVINDGSADASAEIIKEFAESDSRFRYIEQSNQGVSAARNRGLDEATMPYVTFVDGDDLLPARSLQFMHQVAVTNDADTIIGIYERSDGAEAVVNRRSENLAGKTLRISPDDPDLIHTWTLCNKWLSRDLIEKHGIRFEKLSHLEDGVFLYTYLQHAEKIYGCQHIVYRYLKPLPVIGRTTTQKIGADKLDDVMKAICRIEELTASYGPDFRSELIYRCIRTPLVMDYYRRIWRLDENAAGKLTGIINEMFRRLDGERRAALMRSHFDIIAGAAGNARAAEPHYRTREELAEEPLIAVVLTEGVSAGAAASIIEGLYDQYEVRFSLIADRSLGIDADIAGYDNACVADAEGLCGAVRDSGAPYVVFVDADILFNHRTLFRAIKSLEKDEEAEVVAADFDYYDGNKVKKSDLMDFAYANDARGLDVLLANKVVRVSSKIIGDIESGCNGTELLEKYPYKRLKGDAMLALFSEAELMARIKDTKALAAYRKNLKDAAPGLADRAKSTARGVLKKLRGSTAASGSSGSGADKKLSVASCYLDLDVQKDTVVVEGLGKMPKGSSLYILKELASDRYGDLELWFPVRKGTEEDVRSVLEREGLGSVRTVRNDSGEYRRLLFSAEYLFNEVDFPNWWVKKPHQTYVNIWHGTPIKKLGKAKSGVIHRDANASRNFTMADFVLAPSEYCLKHTLGDADVLEISPAKRIMLGYPRTGMLFDRDARERVRSRCGLEGKTAAVWMPTWNDDTSESDLLRFLSEVDAGLDDSCIFFVNLHHKSKVTIDYDSYRHVRRFPYNMDTYEFLTAADVLITDYSSVFFDFAVTGRKIILHCPDRSGYEATRGLYIQPEDLPFPVTYTAEALIGEIKSPRDYDDREFLETFNSYDRPDNARRLCDIVIGSAKDGALAGSAPADPTEVRDPEITMEPVFIVADSFRPGKVTDWLVNIYESGGWPEDFYLSFMEDVAEEHAARIKPMLQGVRIFATKGKPFEERSERKRLYNDIAIRRFVLIDPYDHKRIRSFSRFTEPVQMLLTERQMDMLRAGDKEMMTAVRTFDRYGNGISVLTEEDAAWLRRGMDITADVIRTEKVFHEKYFR